MIKLRNETRIGILAIIAMALGFWGYKFLKGTNVLTPSQTFYVRYATIDQLRPSNPVFINGWQVGTVKAIDIDPQDDQSVLVTLSIERGIEIPKNAKAAIVGLTLMGGKAIEIQITTPCSGDDCAESGDFLEGSTKSLAESLLGDPRQLDIYAQKLKMAFDTLIDPNDPNGLGPSVRDVQATLDHIASITASLDQLIKASSKSISATTANAADITSNLRNSNADIAKALQDLSAVAAQIKNANLDQTARSAGSAIDSVVVSVSALRKTLEGAQGSLARVDSLAQLLGSDKGSAGKLLTDPSLYNNLESITRHLYLLEQDLRLNPNRYTNVKVKLFGRNKGIKYVAPVDDPAYKMLMDSLENDLRKK